MGLEKAVAITENDTGPARNYAWLHQLSESRSEWGTQRAVMEAQLSGFRTRLPVVGSPEARALLTVVVAQDRAIRALLAARSAAAEDLLVARDAVKDLSRAAGRRSADALGVRVGEVMGVLLEAQEEAAETLLAAQTEATRVL
jgi:hypothetical protein